MSRVRPLDANGAFGARSDCRGIGHRGRAAGAVLTAIALVVGLCLAVWAWQKSDTPADRADELAAAPPCDRFVDPCVFPSSAEPAVDMPAPSQPEPVRLSPVVAEDPALRSNPVRAGMPEPLRPEGWDVPLASPREGSPVDDISAARKSLESQNPLRDGLAEDSVAGGPGASLNPLRDRPAEKSLRAEPGEIAAESNDSEIAEVSAGGGPALPPGLLRDCRTEIRLRPEPEGIAQEPGREEVAAPGPPVAASRAAIPNPLRVSSPRVVRLDSVLRVEVAGGTPSDAVVEVTGRTPSDAEVEVLAMFHPPADLQTPATPSPAGQTPPAPVPIAQERTWPIPPAPEVPDAVQRTSSNVSEGATSDAEIEVLAMFRAPSDEPAPAASPSAVPRHLERMPASPAQAEPKRAVTVQTGPQEPAPAQAGRKRAPEEVATPGPTYDFESRPIGTLTVITARRAGEIPADLGREKLAQMQAKTAGDPWVRNWPLICYQWEAPALCHRPLYFEEVNLERYGYGPKYLRVAQPLISAGQFFATVPALPYRIFAEHGRECVYTLGHYRPGSLVPYDVMLPPASLTGTGVESALITGLIFAIP